MYSESVQHLGQHQTHKCLIRSNGFQVFVRDSCHRVSPKYSSGKGLHCWRLYGIDNWFWLPSLGQGQAVLCWWQTRYVLENRTLSLIPILFTCNKTVFMHAVAVFKYPAGRHNVFKVNGTAFQNCAKPPPSEALTTGNDVITLATPGRKWYICGVGMHCLMGGQKLFIEVSQYGVLTPGAAPYPAQEKITIPVATSPAPSPVSGY